jgi:hypothetical protein
VGVASGWLCRLKLAGIEVRDDGVQHDYMHHKARAHINRRVLRQAQD